jgi:fermentation-respiration switch protein FrsA (DUF1100 family)
MSPDRTSPRRATVRIPTASGDTIEAWVYRPESDVPRPAVVMAHGIGGVKAGGLEPYAERFRDEGFVAVVFDYRNAGGSGGQPREWLSVARRREDYGVVIGWAAGQPFVDPRRIIAWGTSFAGLHILELAMSDRRLAAAIAQAPLTDGLAAARMSDPKAGIRLFALAVLDRLGSLAGRPPIYVPGHAEAGGLALDTTRSAAYGKELLTPKDGTPWNDRVTARSLLSFFWRRPVRRAASVQVPLLLIVPEQDGVAPVPAALTVARRAPGAELLRSAGGHYDVYEGGAAFSETLRAEVEFLHRRTSITRAA